jgi:DNA-binding transcriptional ArsR family regulator
VDTATSPCSRIRPATASASGRDRARLCALNRAAHSLDDILRAIAEPRRRAILQLVASEELPAGHIAAHFEVTRPAISQHLTVLKDAGLIAERREGTRRLYRAKPEGLAELEAFIAGMWPDALRRFKLEAESRRGRSKRGGS